MKVKILLGYGLLLTESEIAVLKAFAPEARFKIPADYFSSKTGAFAILKDKEAQYLNDLSDGEQRNARPVYCLEFEADLFAFVNTCPFVSRFSVTRIVNPAPFKIRFKAWRSKIYARFKRE